MNERVKQEFADMLEFLTDHPDLKSLQPDSGIQVMQVAAQLVLAANVEKITLKELSVCIDGDNR